MWKKLQASIYVKYLGIYLGQYLHWSPHVNHLSHKLVKANAMLCKRRHYKNEATIRPASNFCSYWCYIAALFYG